MKDLADEKKLDEKTLTELVELGKSFEDQARKLDEMAEAFAQKYDKRLTEDQKQRLAEAQVTDGERK